MFWNYFTKNEPRNATHIFHSFTYIRKIKKIEITSYVELICNKIFDTTIQELNRNLFRIWQEERINIISSHKTDIIFISSSLSQLPLMINIHLSGEMLNRLDVTSIFLLHLENLRLSSVFPFQIKLHELHRTHF